MAMKQVSVLLRGQLVLTLPFQVNLLVIVPEEELENLRQFMSQLEGSMATHPPSTSSFALAQPSTHAKILHVSSTPSHSWITDSGASDHMIGLSSLFSSCYVCSSRDKVRVIDRTLSSISGKGSVNVSPT